MDAINHTHNMDAASFFGVVIFFTFPKLTWKVADCAEYSAEAVNLGKRKASR